MIVAGLGARHGVPAAEVIALIERALHEAGLTRPALAALATIEAKADEAGLAAAAAHFGLPLMAMPHGAMQTADPAAVGSNSRSKSLYGVSSVSEVSALAAAGPGSALLLARIKSASATCALARSAAP